MTVDDILDFKYDGAVYARSLMNPDLLDQVRAAIGEYERYPEKADPSTIWEPSPTGKAVRYLGRPHQSMPVFHRLISSRVLSLAAQSLGKPVYFAAMDLHCRVAGESVPTPPHQDSFLWCFEEGFDDMVSVYIALTDIDETTANLRIVRGSHRHPTMLHKASTMRGFSSVIAESAAELPEEMRAKEVSVVLRAGDALVFHSKIIHYTEQSSWCERARAACSMRISSYDVRFSKEKQDVYARNVAYNRSVAMREGLTAELPKAQHS